MVLGKFQCRCVLLIRIIVGQGPTVLAVGAGGRLDTLLSPSISLLFSLSLRDGSIPSNVIKIKNN